MDRAKLDIYTDYLICSWGAVTATGLAELVDRQLSHDQITRFLASKPATSADLWQMVKPLVRKIEGDGGVLVLDDSIAEKEFSDESELICWHFDASKNRYVKGINFITAIYHNQDVTLPVAFELIKKTETYYDPKTQKHKRRSPRTKNEIARDLMDRCVDNNLKFKHVLADIFFASAENMRHIHDKLKRNFIMSVKSNRQVATSLRDKEQGKFSSVATLALEANTYQQVYMEGLEFPVLCAKQCFINEDGSEGVRYLVTDDLTLNFHALTTIFQKRWKVEEYHKSLKQNAALTKSPTSTITSQTNHFFAALCGYIKLESLKDKRGLNHFALKSKLYIKAIHAAYQALRNHERHSFAAQTL